MPRVLLLLAILLIGRTCAAESRPNIVFVFSDDHASHAIGAYGGWLKDAAPTPNLDQLAQQGVLFEHCFCTNSLCGPSRAVILTGKHSHINGFRKNGDRFDASQPTFPKMLQQAGYRTAVIGKWHLGTKPTGFDHWEVLPGQGQYYNPDFLTPKGRRRREGYCTDLITDLAVDWLREQSEAGKPFMLMCQHKAPHRPWEPALRHLNLFDGQDLPVPPTLFDDYADNASVVRDQEMEVARHLDPSIDLKLPPKETVLSRDRAALDKQPRLRRMTPAQRDRWNQAYTPKNAAYWREAPQGEARVRWNYQRYLKDYLRCIKAVDESVGRIRASLTDLGLAENTVVIYSSDQGFFLGDHGWYDKRWMYEQSLKMPLIVYWPGVTKPGQRVPQLVQNLDFAQTFLDITGVSSPGDMQGRSLTPLLRGQTPDNWRDAIYYHYYEHPSEHMVAKHYGIRTERYKLMHFYEFDEWEFYDLEEDPEELRNAHQEPRYQATIVQLEQRLRELRRKHRDTTDITPKPEAWRKEQLSRRAG